MKLEKAQAFITDVERQYEWYAVNAGWSVADHYLASVEASCRLISHHPRLGPSGRFTHPRLQSWRYFVLFRPFQKHLLFYELVDESRLIMRRAMHGHRDLAKRLIEPPK